MSDALLLLPDVVLIAIGYLICRFTFLNRPLWDQVERLVYFLLFPVLLFHSIVRRPLDAAAMMPLAGSALAVVLTGVAAAYALRWWPAVDPQLHASGAQVAFRFNSYVALALSERLAGPAGLAWMAVIVSVSVPVCNIAAVWPLARHGGQRYLRELTRNPLILATASGLICSLAGIELPSIVDITLGRIGNAALPLGLMAVGAGLQFGALREGPRLAAALLAIRHLLLPLAAIAIVVTLKLPPGHQAVIVAFAAVPTASSCYVLATRMGGHGGYTAGLVTVSTGLGMLLLPIWMMLWRALG